jgi:hypothetical protein
MNNLRKIAVLLLVGLFTMSMVMAPFAPKPAVDSQVAPPTNYKDVLVEKYQDILDNNLMSEKIDPILASYMETGTLDASVVTRTNGDVKLLLFVKPTFDVSTIADIAKVRWQMDLKLFRVASIDVNSIGALKQLEATDGIQYILADRIIPREPEGSDAPVTDMFHIDDVIGATGTYASNYDGSGVIVGLMDTGIDFSQLDMQGAEYNNGTMAMSYDPSSYGLTEMVIGNNTIVENTTAWLEAGNLLTYESGGKYYLNVTGWDPVCNNGGGPRSLMGLLPPYGDGYPYGNNIGFIGLYEYAWGPVNNVSEFVYHEMWKDWEIPSPGAENYTFGWLYQQREEGYAKVFATSMYYEGNIIIDWNSSLAWNMMWQDAINLQTIDLNTTADRNAVLAGMDWSFEDDYLAGCVYNINNNILYQDGLHDGSDAMGLGSISWAYDDLGYLSHDYGLFPGITEDGMAWNALFAGDPDTTYTGANHGHWTGSAIASRGVVDHDVYDNGTAYRLPGVAPGSSLIMAKGLSTGGSLMADWWSAGFHLNATSGYWEYSGAGPSHHANIMSNSWGWGPGSGYLSLRYLALAYDLLSVPDVTTPGYPGLLFLFSSGNTGADYGTDGAPDSAFSVVSVGASITAHYYQSQYGPFEQVDSQSIFFSSSGPTYTGNAKPDVVAPGYRGASPEPSQNEWMGVPGYDNAYAGYIWWQGTSLSCPIAAGVAALIMDAWNTTHGSMPTPQQTKDLLLSSATDLGYDPYIQGNGLVNAEAACKAIETGAADSYFFESNSFQYYSDQVAEAWAYYMPDYWGPPYTGPTTPVGLETSSVFFGTVERGQPYVVNLGVTGFDLTGGDTSNFDVKSPWYYTEGSRLSFSETSYKYNDTNTNVIRSGFFNLSDYLTLDDFYNAKYATITVATDFADIGAYPTVTLFDWVDTDSNGVLNYWNFTGAVGDEISFISRYYDQCNIMQMRIASTSGIGSLFKGDPVLQFFGDAGIDFTVTIQNWVETPDTAIGLADGASGIDVTLTVPADAEYGAHEGSLLLADTVSGFSHEIPYSYMVEMSLDGAKGENMTLVNGAGTELTPYDNGAVTTSYIYGTTAINEAGGTTPFHIDIPYDQTLNATILVMRVEWQNAGTAVDIYLRNELSSSPPIAQSDDGGGPFVPTPTGDRMNTIVWDNEGDLINGTYWFYYVVHRLDGAAIPEDIKITFQLYGATDLQPAEYSFWWTARDMTDPTTISPDDVLTADYITITSNWTIPAVSGLPEYSTITGTQISLLSGLHKVFNGIYADPHGFDSWPIPLTSTDSYNWHTVDGIKSGDNVRVSIDSQEGADPAIQVYPWTDLNSDGLVTANELGAKLLDRDQGTTGDGESGSFIAGEDMNIAILVFDFNYVWHADNPYVLDVDTRVSIDVPSTTDTATFETYTLLANKTMDMYLYCYTPTNIPRVINFGKVTFNNFFGPELTIDPAVDLGGNLFNFTFSATDRNEGDSIFYSFWISADGGNTYQLVAGNLTQTFFVWDSNAWLERDYYYRVIAYAVDLSIMVDGEPLGTALEPPASYGPMTLTDSAVYGPFAAGGVPIVTTPTTTTTPPTTSTTPPTTPPVTGLDPLLIGLIGGIGVGVVVLLILFLIRKK